MCASLYGGIQLITWHYRVYHLIVMRQYRGNELSNIQVSLKLFHFSMIIFFSCCTMCLHETSWKLYTHRNAILNTGLSTRCQDHPLNSAVLYSRFRNLLFTKEFNTVMCFNRCLLPEMKKSWENVLNNNLTWTCILGCLLFRIKWIKVNTQQLQRITTLSCLLHI